MALFNTKPVIMLLTSILTLHRNSDISFNFPNFSGPYTKSLLTFQGDAFVSSRGVIELTKLKNGKPMPYSAGRATYSLPVRLWDAKTGKMASFKTTFSFNISIGPITGDGISLFLAPFKSDMPQDSQGGFLGLFNPDTAFRNIEHNQIVAVEFDTHQNDEWDPVGPHIGIDINSINSTVTSKEWLSKEWLTSGVPTVFATVRYDSVAKSLSAIFVTGGSTTTTLSHVIDLKTVLPEWVSVGFSGATGFDTELHVIHSWSFSSSFD